MPKYKVYLEQRRTATLEIEASSEDDLEEIIQTRQNEDPDGFDSMLDESDQDWEVEDWEEID
jgi:hypothetical protein